MKFLHVNECEDYPMVFKLSDLNPGDLVGILVTPNENAKDGYWVGSFEGTSWILPGIFISADDGPEDWHLFENEGFFMIGNKLVIVEISYVGCMISKNQQEV